MALPAHFHGRQLRPFVGVNVELLSLVGQTPVLLPSAYNESIVGCQGDNCEKALAPVHWSLLHYGQMAAISEAKEATVFTPHIILDLEQVWT